jgi:hypothetical protein
MVLNLDECPNMPMAAPAPVDNQNTIYASFGKAANEASSRMKRKAQLDIDSILQDGGACAKYIDSRFKELGFTNSSVKQMRDSIQYVAWYDMTLEAQSGKDRTLGEVAGGGIEGGGMLITDWLKMHMGAQVQSTERSMSSGDFVHEMLHIYLNASDQDLGRILGFKDEFTGGPPPSHIVSGGLSQWLRGGCNGNVLK